jgi:integrase
MPHGKISHAVVEDTLYIYQRERTTIWYCRYRVEDKWFRSSTHEHEMNAAIKSANMIYMEAHMRHRFHVAPVSKLFRDIALSAIKRMEEEMRAGEGRVIYKDYIFIINKYLIPAFKGKFVDRITYDDIEDLNVWRMNKMRKVPVKSTMKNHNAALNKVFDEAILRNYMKASDRPRLIAHGIPSERRPVFTMHEARRLLRGFDNWIRDATDENVEVRKLLKDYVHVLIDTGARPGRELLSLTWANIQYASHTDDRLVIHFEKSKTGRRTAIAKIMTIEALDNIAKRNYGKPLSNLIEYQNTDSIFRHKSLFNRHIDNTKRLIRPINFEKQFAAYLKYVNLLSDKITGRPRTFYSLRHTYATFALLYDKVNIHTLAKQMGTSVEMIEKHYSHLDSERAIDQLGGEKTTALIEAFEKPKRNFQIV